MSGLQQEGNVHRSLALALALALPRL